MRVLRTGSFRRLVSGFRRCLYGQDASRSKGFNSERFSKEKLEGFTKKIEEKTKLPRRWLDLYGATTLAATIANNSWKTLRKCATKLRIAISPADPVAPIDDTSDPCSNPFVHGG